MHAACRLAQSIPVVSFAGPLNRTGRVLPRLLAPVPSGSFPGFSVGVSFTGLADHMPSVRWACDAPRLSMVYPVIDDIRQPAEAYRRLPYGQPGCGGGLTKQTLRRPRRLNVQLSYARAQRQIEAPPPWVSIWNRFPIRLYARRTPTRAPRATRRTPTRAPAPHTHPRTPGHTIKISADLVSRPRW